MEEYEDYLLDALVGEQKIVTYRTLSRALNVHVQLAKEMLYAFHTTQNTKRPDSIHATYLLTGYRRSAASTDPDGDELMDDGAPEVRTILLVAQEKLDAVKRTFTRLSSVHIYSLEPSPLPDLNVLAAPNHDLLATFNPTASPEPPALARFGTITNPAAKRRGKPAVIPTAEPPKPTSTSSKPPTKPTAKPSTTDTKESQDPGASHPAVKAPARTKSTAQSFFGKWNAAAEKQKAKPKPAKKPSPPPKKEPSPPPLLSSDDEEEEREPTPEPVHPDPHGEETTDQRAKKRSELEAMMMESSPEPEPKRKREEEEGGDVEMAGAEEKPETGRRTMELPRRRGRRKVMKTVNVKDEDGYLVTRQEAVWESYSEGEEEKPGKQVKVERKEEGRKEDAAAGKKKPVAKKGATKQGNLMSFFGKK